MTTGTIPATTTERFVLVELTEQALRASQFGFENIARFIRTFMGCNIERGVMTTCGRFNLRIIPTNEETPIPTEEDLRIIFPVANTITFIGCERPIGTMSCIAPSIIVKFANPHDRDTELPQMFITYLKYRGWIATWADDPYGDKRVIYIQPKEYGNVRLTPTLRIMRRCLGERGQEDRSTFRFMNCP